MQTSANVTLGSHNGEEEGGGGSKYKVVQI